MNVVDILISIVVVTILVTIILAIVTYVAYKLRLAREPAPSRGDPSALRYFVPYVPPSRDGADAGPSEEEDESPLERLERDVAGPRSGAVEGNATEA